MKNFWSPDRELGSKQHYLYPLVAAVTHHLSLQRYQLYIRETSYRSVRPCCFTGLNTLIFILIVRQKGPIQTKDQRLPCIQHLNHGPDHPPYKEGSHKAPRSSSGSFKEKKRHNLLAALIRTDIPSYQFFYQDVPCSLTSLKNADSTALRRKSPTSGSS